ncbi:hypothetical protein GIV17_14190 [Pseudomonas syringae]|uniref:Uncharacterized protein n=1 Tax=Pseudomonas syringae pv. syringae TaxID=321 RepID=A0AAE5S496_PSESY|nr:hypothetical protein [Pseudomonas syringae]POQ01152.1 hypothetical protein CXB42_24110 [Pseudomonas syringae pv. syringae]MCF5735351.1 hypothetical protein [Pseudomonas syringae]MCF5742288.1 hypothetical protein [Pseudomonas syringae]MCF5750851.1 hypothetical protein [Pseudomonas syringae]
MLPRRKTKIQLHSVTVSSAGAEFLYHQRPILFTNGRIKVIRNVARQRRHPAPRADISPLLRAGNRRS